MTVDKESLPRWGMMERSGRQLLLQSGLPSRGPLVPKVANIPQV